MEALKIFDINIEYHKDERKFVCDDNNEFKSIDLFDIDSVIEWITENLKASCEKSGIGE